MIHNLDYILTNIPERPGVYKYFDKEGTIIYVGKAKNLKRRVNSYFQKNNQSLKTRILVSNIANIEYVVVASEQDAFLLENNLIKQNQPRYNILLKDGKSYPSICITKEEFPRVFKTRKIDKKIGEFYGPYSYGNTLDLLLETIHKLYPIRTCSMPISSKKINEGRYRVCLKYHLGLCSGVCENYCSSEQYANYISEIRKIIQGNANEIADDLLVQMKLKAKQMKFEEAQLLKKQYELLERFKSKTVITNTTIKNTDIYALVEEDDIFYISYFRVNNGSIIQGRNVEYKKLLDEDQTAILSRAIFELSMSDGGYKGRNLVLPFMPDFIDENMKYIVPKSGDRLQLLKLAQENALQYKTDRLNQKDKINGVNEGRDGRSMRILKKLQGALHLQELPVLIESFDNSHIQGSDTVAACVVFKMARPSKSDYRKYIISSSTNNDIASMREAVSRRYSRIIDENGVLPNLIVADGGEDQMNIIQEVLDSLHISIPVVGLVKDSRHRTHSMLYGNPPVEIQLRPTDELFHFLTSIQDEVHRFAISFHRSKRSVRQVKSELDDIKGIGVKTKQLLLKEYNSIEMLKTIEYSELSKLIGKSRASIIYNHFGKKITP